MTQISDMVKPSVDLVDLGSCCCRWSSRLARSRCRCTGRRRSCSFRVPAASSSSWRAARARCAGTGSRPASACTSRRSGQDFLRSHAANRPGAVNACDSPVVGASTIPQDPQADAHTAATVPIHRHDMATVPARTGLDSAGRGLFHVACAITLRRIYVFFALKIGDRFPHLLGTTSHTSRFRRDVRGRTACRTIHADRPPRTELTDRILIFGERHLRTVLPGTAPITTGGQIEGLRLQPPRPDQPAPDLDRRRIRRRPVLGGLINEYERAD
jgi:hypothetical protein